MSEEQVRFYELNKRFLAEVEKGKDWNELHPLIVEMKELAKKFDHLELATVPTYDREQRNSPIN